MTTIGLISRHSSVVHRALTMRTTERKRCVSTLNHYRSMLCAASSSSAMSTTCRGTGGSRATPSSEV